MSPESEPFQPPQATPSPEETPDSAKVERLPERELESLDSFISKIEAGNYDDIIFLDKSGRTFWRALHERCKATEDGSLPQAHFVDIGTEKKIGSYQGFSTENKGTVYVNQFRHKKDDGTYQRDFDEHVTFHFPNPEIPPELFLGGHELPERFYISLADKETFGTQKRFKITNKEDAKEMLRTLMGSDAQKVRELFGDRFDGKKILIIDEEVETAESIKYAQVLFKTAYPTAHVDIGAYKSTYEWRERKQWCEDRKEELESMVDEKIDGEGMFRFNLDECYFLRNRFATEGFSIEPVKTSIHWMGKPTHVEERYENKEYEKYSADRSFAVRGITGELSIHKKVAMADKDGKWALSEHYSPENVKKRGLKGYSDQIKKIRAHVSPEKEKDTFQEEPKPIEGAQEEKGDA